MAAPVCPVDHMRREPELQVLFHHAENQVKEAIGRLPPSKKQAYDKACQTCPQLVGRESHPVVFLRFSRYDAWAAAERLAYYWEDRFELFGERAFLPMTQTGEGALTSDDLVALHAGNFVFLPPSTTTNQDALFVDRTRVLPNSPLKERLRCMFYIFHVLAEKEESQNKGILFFILLVQPRAIHFDHEMMRTSVAMMKRSFPVKVHFHILNSLPKSGKRNMVQHIIQSAVCYVMEHFRDEWEVHIEESPGELKAEMRKLGIPVSGIPARIGGSWKYEEFSKWCRQRTFQERTMGISASTTGATAGALAANASNPDSKPASDSAGKNERKRLVNVIHSREKRERRKAEQKLLEQEAKAMKDKKVRLSKENEFLENLLAQARSIVTSIGEANRNQAPNVYAQQAPNSRETENRDSNTADQDDNEKFQETAAALLKRAPEEQNLILVLLLRKNPQFRKQLESLLNSQDGSTNRGESDPSLPRNFRADLLLGGQPDLEFQQLAAQQQADQAQSNIAIKGPLQLTRLQGPDPQQPWNSTRGPQPPTARFPIESFSSMDQQQQALQSLMRSFDAGNSQGQGQFVPTTRSNHQHLSQPSHNPNVPGGCLPPYV